MRFFERHPAPDFMVENAGRWNRQWADLRAEKPGAPFKWYIYKKRPVNQHLFPLLARQTDAHCAYCDAYPGKLDDDTIDHFRPKSDPDFYHLAYSWVNLYNACGHCQKAKSSQFSVDLLCPDAPGYAFERYFVYNYSTHEIEVNPAAEPADQQKAQTTRTVLGLNHKGQVSARQISYEAWSIRPVEERDLTVFPFRFIFE